MKLSVLYTGYLETDAAGIVAGSSGSIRLNGTGIRDMTQHKLRDHIAYVQQKAWLFSGTIADNLRYSNADASDEDLMHAAEVAQAADFIRTQPQGASGLRGTGRDQLLRRTEAASVHRPGVGEEAAALHFR